MRTVGRIHRRTDLDQFVPESLSRSRGRTRHLSLFCSAWRKTSGAIFAPVTSRATL
jgi:hypothetical protein